MYIRIDLKRSELAANDKLIERVRDLIPEEAGLKFKTYEEFEKVFKGFHVENKFSSLKIEEENDDVSISFDIAEDFVIDTIGFMDKVVDAGSGLVGALTGFLETAKILGSKFGKKVASYFHDYSDKWDLKTQPAMYGVIQYSFHYHVGDDILKAFGASVITRSNGQLQSVYGVVDHCVDYSDSDYEEWEAALKMAEDTAIKCVEDDFCPMYHNLSAAKDRVDYIVQEGPFHN